MPVSKGFGGACLAQRRRCAPRIEKDEIAPRCSGFGNVATQLDHQTTCWEHACDLRYVDEDFDWNRVVIAYAERGESLAGADRTAITGRVGHRMPLW